MIFKSKLQYSAVLCFSLLLSACGGGSGGSGSSGGSTLPPPPPADTTAPSVSFSPTTLAVESGQTATSTLTATDAVGVTTGPSVTCTNGGSFANNTFTAPTVTVETTSVCTATASDAAGNEGAGTLTVTIQPPNTAPTSSISSNITTVMEGQPFILTAMGSDSNGDPLTYSWSQNAGTMVTFDDATTAVQTLNAPQIDVDETLSFEVTVSDGEDTATSTISINVEDLTSESSVSAPNIYNGSNTLSKLYALTANDDGGYRVYWKRESGLPLGVFSSQDYTVDGLVFGTQVDGEFQLPGGQNDTAEDVLTSGDSLYYINRYFGEGLLLGYSYYEGLQSGAVLGPGDVIYLDDDPNFLFQSVAGAPIGTNQLVTVSTSSTNEADYIVRATILNPDGTSAETVLATPNFIVDDASVAVFFDNSFIGLWQEYQTSDSSDPTNLGDSDVYMQRAAMDGTLLGSKVKLNLASDASRPMAVTLQDGNVFLAWHVASGIRVQVIRPDGTFATPVMVLPYNGVLSNIVALNTNQILISRTTGNRLVSRVLNSDGTSGSNDFVVFIEPEGSNLITTVKSVTLNDNRVILGWELVTLTNPGTSRESFTAGLLPVGK